jgi:hypothetical protein
MSRSIGRARARWPDGNHHYPANILARMEPAKAATPTNRGSIRTRDGPLRTAAILYLPKKVSCSPGSRPPGALHQSALQCQLQTRAMPSLSTIWRGALPPRVRLRPLNRCLAGSKHCSGGRAIELLTCWKGDVGPRSAKGFWIRSPAGLAMISFHHHLPGFTELN